MPALKPLPHDSVTPYDDAKQSKKEQVAQMFDNIAGSYDRLNRVLTAGIDIRWRKKAIKSLSDLHPQRILDVATGTGDMALLAYRLLKPAQIIGIDISREMLELGRKKIEKEGVASKIELQTGDSETIKFADHSFDAVMVAFGVRNFENLENGLKEMLRVLKPGGKLVVLEFSRPRLRIFRWACNVYMSIVAPEIARWFSQNKKAYQYLNHSVRLFPERTAFVEILNRCGYSDTSYKTLSAGICCIYAGRRSPAASSEQAK